MQMIVYLSYWYKNTKLNNINQKNLSNTFYSDKISHSNQN